MQNNHPFSIVIWLLGIACKFLNFRFLKYYRFIDQEKRQLKVGDFGLARNAQYNSTLYEGTISTSPLAWAWIAKEIVCSESEHIFVISYSFIIF